LPTSIAKIIGLSFRGDLPFLVWSQILRSWRVQQKLVWGARRPKNKVLGRSQAMPFAQLAMALALAGQRIKTSAHLARWI
jgi:hypothetical protein